MDAPGRFSVIVCKRRKLLWLSVLFGVHQTPGRKLLTSEKDQYWRERQTLLIVASLVSKGNSMPQNFNKIT